MTTAMPIIGLPSAAARRRTLRAKRCLDLVLSVPLLVVASPLMLVIAIAVRCSSRGPAIFRSERIGLGRRPFQILKFRSMRVGADDAALRAAVTAELAGTATGPVDGSFKLANDQRITRLGGWLRRTSLDELPQLWNVVRGEMSLVGPRPCLEWEAELFGPAYRSRFDVPPGMTGLWQVSGRSRLATPEMLALDHSYVEQFGLGRDIVILVRTVPALLRGSGAR